MSSNLTPRELSEQIRADAIDQLTEVADEFNLDYRIKKNHMLIDLPEVVEDEE